MSAEREFLKNHSAHDVEGLYARWEKVAHTAGLTKSNLGADGDFDVLAWKSTAEPEFYVSAAIHGDEPAGSLALIDWAEENTEFLTKTPCLIIPCFNPWGLSENIRRNSKGEDLNRCFSDDLHPLMKAWRELVGDSQFKITISLHEDYDAHGIYMYELGVTGENPGEACLQACEKIIPREHDLEIEGRAADNGLLQMLDNFDEIVTDLETHEGGLPEAIYLRLHHSEHAITFETPSEFSLFDRVRAHKHLLTIAISRGL